jgi:hypothetical protein
MKHRIFAIAAILLVGAAIPMLGHHSFSAQYDANKRKTLTGPVTKMDWINPHARFFVDVVEDGKTTNWEVELGAPAILMRSGWTRNSLKVGQIVTVAGSLAKDGSSMLNASNITVDGKRLFAGSSQSITP